MKLRRLHIRRMPGIDDPFAVNLADDLVLIVGPNGSGKTTICRAAAALLWPGWLDHNAVDLESDWQDQAGAPWEATLVGRGPSQWQAGGDSPEAPPLPPAQIAGSYRLGLTDLLGGQDDGTDRSLADEIRRQAAGGYSLDDVEQSLFRTGAQIGRTESRELIRAESERTRRLEEHRRIADSQARLDDLLGELAAARTAREEVELFQAAQSLLAEREKAKLADRSVEAFPAGMDRLTGDELKRLAEEEQSHQDHQRHLETATEQSRALEQTLADLDFPGGPLGREVLDGWAEKARRAEELGRLLEQLSSASAAAADKQRNAAEGLGLECGESSPAVDRALVGELSQRLEEIEALRSSQQAVATEEQIVSQRARGAARARAGWGRWLPVALSLALMAAGGYLGYELDQGWYLLGALGLLGLVLAWWKTASGAATDRDHVDQLAAKQRVLDEQLREKQAAFTRQAEGAGLTLERVDASALWFIDRLSSWQSAQAEWLQATELQQREQSRFEQVASELEGFLSRHGVSDPVDPALVRGAVEELDRRSREIESARRQLGDFEQTRRFHQSGLEKTESKIAGIFRDAGIDSGEKSELRARLARREEFHEAIRCAQDAAARVSVLEEKLSRRRDLLDSSEEQINQQLAQAQTRAEGFEELTGQIARIKEEGRRAREGRELEEAMAEVDRRRQELSARRDEVLHAQAGRFLLERVREQHEQESQPEVLAHARQLLGLFTDQRYDLKLSDDPHRASFRAVDQTRGDTLELTQLSDGTRTQLLLAVRLAFIAEAEKGAPWPLFLDDTLAATDGDRFKAVAGNLVQMVDRGRQVIYLTCDPGEITRWNQVLEGLGRERIPAIDLAHERSLAGAPTVYEIPAPAPVPAPGEHSAEAYARLIQVPAWNPLHPVERVHLYYLLEKDLASLHALLECRIETVGQFRSLRRAGRADGLLPAETLRTLEQEIALVSSFLQAFRQGRGRIVDRLAIEQSQAVSEVFLEEVSQLAGSLGGDARELINALDQRQVKGFRGNQKEKLAAYLTEHGHLDPLPVLDRAALEERVLGETELPGSDARTLADRVGRLRALWELSTNSAHSEYRQSMEGGQR